MGRKKNAKHRLPTDMGWDDNGRHHAGYFTETKEGDNVPSLAPRHANGTDQWPARFSIVGRKGVKGVVKAKAKAKVRVKRKCNKHSLGVVESSYVLPSGEVLELRKYLACKRCGAIVARVGKVVKAAPKQRITFTD